MIIYNNNYYKDYNELFDVLEFEDIEEFKEFVEENSIKETE